MSQQQTPIRLYGNINNPRKEGVLGLSALATAIGTVVAIAIFLTMPLGIWVQTAIVILGIAAMIAVSLNGRNGRKKFEEILAKRHFNRAEKEGHTTYVAGPVSQLPTGDFPPVGILARTELVDFLPAGAQVEKAMIWNPSNRTGTIIFSVQSPGIGLLDQDNIDMMVDQWGIFQREAGVISSLVQVGATTQATVYLRRYALPALNPMSMMFPLLLVKPSMRLSMTSTALYPRLTSGSPLPSRPKRTVKQEQGYAVKKSWRKILQR